jgi:hypothetical protein
MNFIFCLPRSRFLGADPSLSPAPGRGCWLDIQQTVPLVEPSAGWARHQRLIGEVIEDRAADVTTNAKFHEFALSSALLPDAHCPHHAEQSKQDAEIVDDEFGQGGLEHIRRKRMSSALASPSEWWRTERLLDQALANTFGDEDSFWWAATMKTFPLTLNLKLPKL